MSRIFEQARLMAMRGNPIVKTKRKMTSGERKAKRLAVMIEAMATRATVGADGSITATIMMPFPNPLNGQQGRWWVTAGHRKDQRKVVSTVIRREKLPPLPIEVQLTRLGKGCDGWDALPASLKSVVDAIAEECYETKDHDPRITWLTPKQELSKRVGVRIEIVGRISEEG